jgi:hypothetical protein
MHDLWRSLSYSKDLARVKYHLCRHMCHVEDGTRLLLQKQYINYRLSLRSTIVFIQL